MSRTNMIPLFLIMNNERNNYVLVNDILRFNKVSSKFIKGRNNYFQDQIRIIRNKTSSRKPVLQTSQQKENQICCLKKIFTAMYMTRDLLSQRQREKYGNFQYNSEKFYMGLRY